MKQIIRILMVLVALVVISGGVIAQEATEDREGWPENFIVGVYPDDNVEAALAAVEPLRVYLEETLGIRTVLITGTSYNAVIEAMRAGRADAMEVGPFSYLLAAEVAGAEAIAIVNYDEEVTMENVEERIDPDVLPGYYSVLFTVKGSGIRTVADLEGQSFAFTDPASTSGYLIPATTIMTTMGFEQASQIEDFADIVFAGNHPSAVTSVAGGTTAAGATFDANLIAAAAEGVAEVCGYVEGETFPYTQPMTQEEIDAIYDECPDGNIVVFAQSAVIPETPFAINGEYPQSFKDAVQAALLDIINDPELVVALRRYYVNPIEQLGLESLDNFYDGLRDTARLLDIDLGG